MTTRSRSHDRKSAPKRKAWSDIDTKMRAKVIEHLIEVAEDAWREGYELGDEAFRAAADLLGNQP